MAHNLFNGRIAFVDELSWHKLGVRVPATVTAAEMIEAAGLAWNVEVRPAPGARVSDPRRGTYNRYVIERDRVGNEKEKPMLGLVGSRYVALQNKDAFSFFEPFVSNGWATFHTAGALGNGERIWVLAKMSGQILIGNDDPIDKYLLLSNTHDGSGVVSIRFTPIRVVCQNTLDWAKEGGVSVVSVRHSKNIAENMKKAQADELMRIIDKVFAEAEMLFGDMAARTLRVDDIDRFLELLFPRTDKQKRAATDPERWVPQVEAQERWTRKLEPERWGRIKHILGDPEVTPPATRHTLWGLYNAIVRDEDYRASRQSSVARLERIWFGSGHDLKTRALNLARQQLRPAA